MAPSARRRPLLPPLLLPCLAAQLLVLCLAGLALQFAAVHRLDRSSQNDGNLLASSSSAGAAATPARPTIAYVVTLTGCGDGDKRYTKHDAIGLVTQGAAVLRHSVHLAHAKSKYDYRMYALVHPAAKECSAAVAKLGYTALVRNTPFDARDIRQEFLREHIDGASCCGRKEYVKLYAYTLTGHPVAVVLDLDSLILRPLDELFDAMLVEGYDWEASSIPMHVDEQKAIVGPSTGRRRVDAFYTRDYNMVNAGGEQYAGVQGGFLVVRPNETTFEEYVDIVLEGDYRSGKGWGGKYGYFFGGMQIQGICAYYYGERRPDAGIELNRCRINAMVDNPRFGPDDRKRPGQCRDGRERCEDCRTTDVTDVLSAHFTICQKPWECRTHWENDRSLCARLHGEWFRIRRSFEEARTDDDGLRQLPPLEGAFEPDRYHGYCTKPGRQGYLPVKI
ncbi:hypothetical protein ACHAXT_011332 [Thalassiosira profunda]